MKDKWESEIIPDGQKALKERLIELDFQIK